LDDSISILVSLLETVGESGIAVGGRRHKSVKPPRRCEAALLFA
jgi:hypothetical protein